MEPKKEDPVDFTVCNKTDCENIPNHFVRIVLKCSKDTEPARTTPIVAVCADHSLVRWKDFVTRENWEAIINSFKVSGYQPPRVKFSYLEIIPIHRCAACDQILNDKSTRAKHMILKQTEKQYCEKCTPKIKADE